MSTERPANLVWHPSEVTREDRAHLNGHRGAVVWLTGLSGSGKSTVARGLEAALFRAGVRAYGLDGDNLRHGLNRDLGFSPEDRRENIRRVGEVARLFFDAGFVVLVSFISPFRDDRDRIRSLVPPGSFIEVHVRCSLETCERRDTKGLYGKARKGELLEFTGISSPYEEPLAPEVVIDTEREDVAMSVGRVLACLREREILAGLGAAR